MATSRIIKAALAATTLRDAQKVQALIEAAVGGRYPRPLGDTWKNLGVFSWTGSVDLKVTEPVTNMQDAVIEKLAMLKFGSRDRVPYSTPRAAAEDLLRDIPYQAVGDMVTVAFHESDPPATSTKRLTAVFRDRGIGLLPSEMPSTIFGVGSSGKDDCAWLQGAFGMGGKSVYRYAQSVIVVSRKDPALLVDCQEDLISVAVVERAEHAKTDTLYYLVDRPWGGAGCIASPYSAPASDYPAFEPGTHLALVSMQVEGYHRQRLGDERTFDTVLDTRLFEPVTPVRFRNEIARERNTYLRGLERRLEANPREEWRYGEDVLPFNVEGVTYRLPVKFWVFSAPSEPGARRKFVAAEHALMFTSNGQSHKHWSPQDFRHKTELHKLGDRILVVVETDDLPIRVRTYLFSPDRSDSMFSDTEVQLENAVTGFLNAWEELREIQNDLIRDAIMGDGGGCSTALVAQRIARALSLRGFGGGGDGGAGAGPQPARPTRPPRELYADPTHLEGPTHALAKHGTTKFLIYSLNAVDGFDTRAELSASCSHPEIGEREITIGRLHNGLIRVSVAVPAGAELGEFELEFAVDEWLRSSGGTGPRMSWTTALEVVDELPSGRRGGAGGAGSGHGGAGEGRVPPVLWTKAELMSDWDARTVGEVMKCAASEIAAMRPEDYGALASLGSADIDTLFLNEDYGPLKDYRVVRLARVGEDAVRMSEERYATGAGVGLFLLEQERRRKITAGDSVDEDLMLRAASALARAVLSVLPDFDRLAQEAGLERG
jgi:hypothetical protein